MKHSGRRCEGLIPFSIMEVGNKIIAIYHDGRKFIGTITLIENQTGEWSDKNPNNMIERVMVRIQNEKGNFQSFWLDKCQSVEV